MKGQFSLIICIIIYSYSSGQTSTIKVRADTINIIGQWVRIYDKTPTGKTIKVEKNKMDTLNYYPDNKVIKWQQTSYTTATWKINQIRREIYYENIEVKYPPREPFAIYTTSSDDSFPSHYVVKSGRDTLILLFNAPNNQSNPYDRRYYIRKK